MSLVVEVSGAHLQGVPIRPMGAMEEWDEGEEEEAVEGGPFLAHALRGLVHLARPLLLCNGTLAFLFISQPASADTTQGH